MKIKLALFLSLILCEFSSHADDSVAQMSLHVDSFGRIRISEIDPNSQAYISGMRIGDVIKGYRRDKEKKERVFKIGQDFIRYRADLVVFEIERREKNLFVEISEFKNEKCLFSKDDTYKLEFNLNAKFKDGQTDILTIEEKAR